MGAVQEKTWFSRNWKWFVPLVSLGVVTLSLGFCTATMFGLFGMMKTSGAYKQALQRAAGHPEVVRALGSPVKPGLSVAGSLQVSGSSGTADLEIPLSGPTGKGTLFVVARKTAGRWQFSTLFVHIQGKGERIDILTPAEGGPRRQVPPDTPPGVLI